MKRYCVVEPESSDFMRVGIALDKDCVAQIHGFGGRGSGWYDYWDVVLDFDGNPDGAGVGFKLYELCEI